MSANNLQYQFQIAYDLGMKESEAHSKYMRHVMRLLDDIFDSEIPLEKRILNLHKLGLTDNKIDSSDKVEYYFRLLSEELSSQTIYTQFYQWQNLSESINRCNYYIEEVARLISPNTLDTSAGDIIEDPKEREASGSSISI